MEEVDILKERIEHSERKHHRLEEMMGRGDRMDFEERTEANIRTLMDRVE